MRNLIADTTPNAIALPAHPVGQDAELIEAPLQITATAAASDRAKRIQAAWEAPIPTTIVHAAREAPAPKLGAPSPRRNFRRLARQGSNTRAHAALAFAIVTLTAGSLLIAAAQNSSADSQPKIHAIETGGISLSSASADAVGLEDIAPAERERTFEPPTQVGRSGLEPPSARRASYRP